MHTFKQVTESLYFELTTSIYANVFLPYFVLVSIKTLRHNIFLIETNNKNMSSKCQFKLRSSEKKIVRQCYHILLENLSSQPFMKNKTLGTTIREDFFSIGLCNANFYSSLQLICICNVTSGMICISLF